MHRRTSFLLVVIAMAIAACGDDAPADSTAGPATTVQPPPPSSTAPPTTATAARQPTEAETRSAALLFDWDVTFTKTATVVTPPVGEMANGTVYMIDLEIEGVCDDASCIQESHAHVDNPWWGWTITEPLVDSEWVFANDRWTIAMDGYYLSAGYGAGNDCIYAWNEQWDIQVTEAVQNGNIWLATGFMGTMVRSEGLDQVRSALAIGNGYCPPYQGETKWDAASTRVMAPIP
jgi:hypothetical protein